MPEVECFTPSASSPSPSPSAPSPPSPSPSDPPTVGNTAEDDNASAGESGGSVYCAVGVVGSVGVDFSLR